MSHPTDLAFWVNTVCREHVRIGARGGFTQAGHGSAKPLKKLRRSDRLVFYSPRTALRSGQKLQAFTALGHVTDDEPYQVEMKPDFHPWRRRVAFTEGEEAPIRPLLEDLSFLPKGRSWGLPFRRGLFEIPHADFARIAAAMKAREILGANS